MSIQPQHFRPFKIEVFGLQDAYLGTLYSYNDGFIGQVEEPSVTVSTDGSSTFTCSIPKYYIDPTTNQKVLNPRWGDVENGVLAENTRVLKVFVSFENEVKIFPFIINKIQDKRDKSFSVFKEIEGGGLAFAELGKQGYKLELNQTLVEYALEEDPNITMTVQYWLDQVFPNVKDANGKIIQWLTPWCYEVRMDWSNYSDFQRDSTKVYEDEYVSNWDVSGKALVPSGYTAAREKARAIDCHNSNKYNITQSIAEAFEIFCDYDYKCDVAGRFIGEYTDEKGNVWTGRKALFYNQAISQENPLHIYYQKNLQSISRAAESEELFTKLFITPIESSSMENGYVTIADTMANPTLDDFLLNFDYLYSVNSISEYQMQFVKEYEASIRSLNLKLLHASPILNDLAAQINDQKAELAGLDKKVAAAKEQLTYYEKLRDNELTNGTVIKDKSNATSIIFTEDNGVYKAALRFEGIVKGTIRGYKDSAYDTLLFSADQLKEITDISSVGDTGYYVLLDEYGYPSYICSKKPDESLVYLSLEYSPTNKYETICQTFYNEIDLNTQRKTAIEETISGLEENYTAQEKEYDNNLAAKEALNQKLERVLGPALREGYWTPDEYDDPGKQYIKQFTQPQFNNTLSETCFFYDSEPFDNEQLAYYYVGSSKTYYPYLRINSLINKWSDKDIDDLIIHLQRDFIGTMQSTTALTAGNYFFLCNNKKYYFSLAAAQIATGNTLTVRMSGTEVSLLLNGSTPIVLSSYLANASNLTSFFEGATENLADYYLYNNAGFVFAFMNIEGNICEPVLLFNNEDLADIYENYTRVAYSFVGENIVTSIEGYLTKNTSHELYYPRFYLAEANVFSSSNLLTVALKKGEEETILEKYYDYSILLRQGKTYITLKITSDNPIWKFVSNEYYYEVNYRSSLANDLLYLDAKEVAKENSQPKYSYDLSVAILPTQNGKMPEIKLGQLAYISDPILGVRAATGYVSEITFDLKKPQNDNIKIANYKTKFEDLFQTITASSEAMKNNQTSYDIAAGSFGPDGSISGDVIQTAINNNSFFFDYSATGVEIDPVNGIVLTNKKPYMNGVYGQVVLQGGGVFLSNSIDPLTGERIWNTGITPNGINASIINAGQLNTNLIKIYSGDEMAFQWNSEGIYAYKFDDNGKAKNDTYIKYSQDGLHYTKEQVNEDGTRSNPLHIVSLDWDGLTLRNNQGQKTLSLEAETGDLLISGTMQSYNYVPGVVGSGWQINQDGNAEFNNVKVRGTISASVFEYEETTAVGGKVWVAPTLILLQDKTSQAILTISSATNRFIIAPPTPFVDSNYNQCGRTWNTNDLIIFNGLIVNKDNPQEIYEIKQLQMHFLESPADKLYLGSTVTISNGYYPNIFYNANGTLVEGDENIALWENIRKKQYTGTGSWHLIYQGTGSDTEGILITAIDEGNKEGTAPYIDVYDSKNNDSNSHIPSSAPKVRLGNLEGLKDIVGIGKGDEALFKDNIGGYGLYADNVYLKGAIYATSGKIGSLTIQAVEDNITNIDFQLTSSTGFTYAPALGKTAQIGLDLYVGNIKTEQFPATVANVRYKYQYRIDKGSWNDLSDNWIEWSTSRLITLTTPPQTNYEYRGVVEITLSNSSTEEKYTSIKSFACVYDGAKGDKGDKGDNGAAAVQYKLAPSHTTIVRDLDGIIIPKTLQITVNKITGDTIETNIVVDNFKLKCEIIREDGSIYNEAAMTPPTTAPKTYFMLTPIIWTDMTFKSLVITLQNKSTGETLDSVTIPFELGDKLRELGKIQNNEVIIADGKVYAEALTAGSVIAGKVSAGAIQTGAIAASSTLYLLAGAGDKYNTPPEFSAGQWTPYGGAKTLSWSDASNYALALEEGFKTIWEANPQRYTNGVKIGQDGVFIRGGGKFEVDMEHFKVTSEGVVKATGGEIGGWKIGTYSLTAGSGQSYVAISTSGTSETSYRIWAGDSVAASAPFSVMANGTLKASKGTIGGWNLNENLLYSGSGKTRVALSSAPVPNGKDDTYRIWAGNDTAASAPFSVTAQGVLKAISGNIGGWTIGPNKLSAGDTDGAHVSLSSAGEYRIWAGSLEAEKIENDVKSYAPFYIKQDGTIGATKGNIGGWTIGETSLHSGSGTSYVALSSDSNSNYRIWAGNSDPSSAAFAVTKDGSVYLDKVYVQTGIDDAGQPTYSTKSLTDYPLWAIWNAYNGNPVSMNYNNGTLTITTRGGTPLTANFNIAVGVGTHGSGVVYAIDANGEPIGTAKGVSLAENGDLQYTAGNTTAKVDVRINLGGGSYIRTDSTNINVEPILNSVTVDTAEVDGTVTFTDTNYAQIPITVVTTNKLTYMTTLPVDCSDVYERVTVDRIEITGKTWTVDQYAYANITATASNGKYKTEQISIYANDIYQAGQDSCAITSISLSNQFQSTSAKRVSFTATASGTNLDSFPKSLYVDASEIYEAGVEAGKAAMSLSRNGSTISIVENPNGAKSMSYTYVKSSHTKTGQYTCTYKESKFYWN